jgi:Zn-dependent peptidase ImmA (M78 family)
MPLFSASRVRLARELRGLTVTELATRMRLSPGTVSHYETGRIQRLPDDSLTRLAEVLGFPPTFFTDRPDVVCIEPESCRYRGRSRIAVKKRRFIESRAELFDELMDVLDGLLELPKPDIPSLSASPEDAATGCRREWGLGDGPIQNTIDLLELHGAWILMLEGDLTKDVDALSYWFNGRAVIVLNPVKGDAYRSRYDVAHELGHLVMHVEHSPGNAERTKQLEAEANQFASAFLMPAFTWRREAPRSVNPWDYLPLKAKWRTSAAAMIRRSRDIGILTQQQYEAAVVRYSRLGWRTGEPGMEFVERERPRVLPLCIASLKEAGASRDSLATTLALYPRNLEELFGNLTLPPLTPASGEKKIVNLDQWRAMSKTSGQ